MRVRKIQDELRLNELAELAFEAKRAALVGRKKMLEMLACLARDISVEASVKLLLQQITR